MHCFKPPLVALLALLLSAPAAAVLAPAPDGISAEQIAQRAEDNLRSDQTIMEARMTVVSPRLTRPRVMEFTSWDDREGERSFIRMQAPSKDKGTGFLKLHPNLWTYIPRVERTMRIPPSMMMQSWMGSDFSNDDLVNESSETDDYTHRILGVENQIDGHDGRSAYVIEYVPKEEAPVVWGKIIAWVDTDRGLPLKQEFYDEDGDLMRSMRFDDVRQIGERWVPHNWSMQPEDKEGHETRIEILRFVFDADLDEDIFTKRNLRKGMR